jgi:hypothetical protein
VRGPLFALCEPVSGMSRGNPPTALIFYVWASGGQSRSAKPLLALQSAGKENLTPNGMTSVFCLQNRMGMADVNTIIEYFVIF